MVNPSDVAVAYLTLTKLRPGGEWKRGVRTWQEKGKVAKRRTWAVRSDLGPAGNSRTPVSRFDLTLEQATPYRRLISRHRLRSEQCGDGFTNHVYTRCIEYDRMQTASGLQILFMLDLRSWLGSPASCFNLLACQVSMAVLFLSMLTQLASCNETGNSSTMKAAAVPAASLHLYQG